MELGPIRGSIVRLTLTFFIHNLLTEVVNALSDNLCLITMQYIAGPPHKTYPARQTIAPVTLRHIDE